jgi:hypothetical protein
MRSCNNRYLFIAVHIEAELIIFLKRILPSRKAFCHHTLVSINENEMK